MNYLKTLVLLIGFILLAGCSSLPCATGCISQHTSSFDGTEEISMSPSYVYRSKDGISGSDMRIGLYWSSVLPDGNVVLIVLPHKDKPVSTGTVINLNINGQLESFLSITKDKVENLNPSTEALTYFHPNVIEQMNILYYVVTKDFINKLIEAQDVHIRIDLENTYLEGVFSHNSSAAAKQDFVKFIERLYLVSRKS